MKEPSARIRPYRSNFHIWKRGRRSLCAPDVARLHSTYKRLLHDICWDLGDATAHEDQSCTHLAVSGATTAAHTLQTHARRTSPYSDACDAERLHPRVHDMCVCVQVPHHGGGGPSRRPTCSSCRSRLAWPCRAPGAMHSPQETDGGEQPRA